MEEDLDLHYTTVRNWIRQYKRDGSGRFPRQLTSNPLIKLRKEIEDLKEENAILKKAAVYFEKNQK